MSFITGTQTECLFNQTPTSTKNNFTTQAVISAPNTQPRCILPANFWNYQGIGKGLLVFARGIFSVASATTPTLAIALCLDGTPGTIGTPGQLFISATVTTASGVTNAGWSLEAMVTAQTVSNTTSALQIDGEVVIGAVANGSNSTAPNLTQVTNNITTFNFETSAAVELAATWGTASASNTITVKQFMVFGVN